MITDRAQHILNSLKKGVSAPKETTPDAPDEAPEPAKTPQDRVRDQINMIHDGWFPDLVIHAVGERYSWSTVKKTRPKLAEDIQDALEGIDLELTRYLKGDATWNMVQIKINAYSVTWEALYKVMFK